MLFYCCRLQRTPTQLKIKLNKMCLMITRERERKEKILETFVFVSRHCEAPTRALSPCTCPSATRSAWTQLYASHTPAAATGCQSPSDRYTHKHTLSHTLPANSEFNNQGGYRKARPEEKAERVANVELLCCVGNTDCKSWKVSIAHDLCNSPVLWGRRCEHHVVLFSCRLVKMEGTICTAK